MARSKKPVMDRLARKAAAARAEGLSYGQWVAKHPEGLPPDPAEEEEKRARLEPYGTRVCVWCGKTFPLTKPHDARRYCTPECRETSYREKKNALREKYREKEKSKK